MSSATMLGTTRSAPAMERERRRALANARVTNPVAPGVKDPLAPSTPRPLRGTLSALGLFGIAAALHALVLGFFLLANVVGDWLAEEPEPTGPEASVLAIETPEPEPEPEPPPPEEPTELPPPSLPSPIQPERPTPSAVPPKVMGLTADSTTEGGSGPAFRIGAGLGLDTRSLTEDVLGAAEVNSKAAMVMTADAVDTPPKPSPTNRLPTPPSRAVRKQESGLVVLRLLIDAEGAVQEVEILQSQPAGLFDEAVLEVAPTWKFSPATYKGEAVGIRVDQTLRFNLG